MNGQHFSVKDLRREYNKGKIDELERILEYIDNTGECWEHKGQIKKRILLLENTSTVVEDSRATHSKREKKWLRLIKWLYILFIIAYAIVLVVSLLGK